MLFSMICRRESASVMPKSEAGERATATFLIWRPSDDGDIGIQAHRERHLLFADRALDDAVSIAY
ncbi:hypothetical protein ASC76_10155 [Rhizobacter sp. Root404]|nr:hypothetical protein ASC76_10155 [Rhizobacter sp. Root404]